MRIKLLGEQAVSEEKGENDRDVCGMKAAFDSVDRAVLIKAMRKKGIREELVERVEKIIRETKSKMKAGGSIGENFWMTRGVRQGCPLNPLLFNIIMADLEENMGRVK